MYGEDAIYIDENTCHRWLREFREGDRNCLDQARSGRPSHVGEDDIEQAIRNNPTMQELAKTFNVLRSTLERQLVNTRVLRENWIVEFHIA
ncbi:histone-lysine N-methyltransferase SETMAR [Trichonephila clavipes]|nr:histone-lysine N-methyltransferase SETMAR [Trichonephila clavipes]